VWLGLMGYLVYAYALYAFEKDLQPGVPVLHRGAGPVALGDPDGLRRRAPLALLPADPERPPPRRARAVYLADGRDVRGPVAVDPATFHGLPREPPDGNAIFVQDLAFVLPLLAVTARLLWLGRPMGDLLAVPVLVKMATLGLSVLLGTLISPLYGLPLKPFDVAFMRASGRCRSIFCR
jgi:hypothetical protein